MMLSRSLNEMALIGFSSKFGSVVNADGCSLKVTVACRFIVDMSVLLTDVIEDETEEVSSK